MEIKRGIAASFALTASVLLTLSGAAPALAGGGPSVRLPRLSEVRSASGSTTSTTFGGWEFGLKTATSVTTEFTVPALTCTSATTGIAPTAAVDTGTTSAAKFSAAVVLLVCLGGSAEAIPAVIVNGTETNGSTLAAAGDLIKCTVVLSPKRITARVEDLTVGHTFRLKQSGAAAAAVRQELIGQTLVADNGQPVPVADFGKMEFTKTRVSGMPIGSVPAGTRVNMQNTQNQLQIRTGWPFPGTKGHLNNKNAFRSHWEHG